MIDVEKAGKATGKKINVELSYRIIELFSAGLYSSPNKAFEELVTNSYDADATTVAVGVPTDIDKNDYLWVLDDGTSMNSLGLQDLWRIGDSRKRDQGFSATREQVGKFGIGKLATYILTYKLTYICKSAANKYLMVTMDYGRLDKSNSKTQNFKLVERQLTTAQARSLVEEYTISHAVDLSPIKLFGSKAKKTWTFCLMSRLKPKAKDITVGRLKWVLRTALPLNPSFMLFFNGDELKSSKIDNKAVKKWTFGKNDDVVKKNDKYTATKYKKSPAVDLPNIKNVRGSITFYENSFATGSKSEDQGRSHGIFLIVRERLINLDDALLGMGPFAHGAFNRTRIMVYADELDDDITSTRESIKESPAYEDLKKYITSKFNVLHSYYLDANQTKAQAKDVPYKLSTAAYSLTRAPFYTAATRVIEHGEQTVLIDIPEFDDDADSAFFLDSIKDDLESNEGIVQHFEDIYESPASRICRFDLESRTIYVNALHPYMVYLREEAMDSSVIQTTATMEVLLEAQMMEEGVADDQRKGILSKRDLTLRNLCKENPLSASAVAQAIADAENDEVGLETVLVQAFNVLGFDAAHIGGSGKPDGLATASLQQISKADDHSYKVTLEAKSTGHKAAQSSNIDIATIAQHRKNYSADHAVVVARDFQGDDTVKLSKISENAITCVFR